MALPQSGGISSAHIICIHTCTDSEGCLIYQWILGVSDSPPARPASHVTVCPGSRSTFPLQVCSKTGGSWVLYCKSSRCSNKTSRPELILPPQQSVVSCTADSLTSIYSTYLSQLGFIIGVYVQGLVMFALQELRPKNHKSPRIETAVIAATDWTHILAPLGWNLKLPWRWAHTFQRWERNFPFMIQKMGCGKIVHKRFFKKKIIGNLDAQIRCTLMLTLALCRVSMSNWDQMPYFQHDCGRIHHHLSTFGIWTWAKIDLLLLT